VINETVARKLLTVVDAGLCAGVGEPIPGQMCVEAAVCYALGQPHGDKPECVAPVLRSLKIRLNDSVWSSNEARAKGMRRLAVAQLGSAGVLDEAEFRKRVVTLAIQVYVPMALRAAADMKRNAAHKDALESAAAACENEPTRHNALQARAAACTAAAAAEADADAAAEAAAYAAACTADAADAAYAAADAEAAAYAAAERDRVLANYAERIVQILIDMNAPGCQWLWLTEAA